MKFPGLKYLTDKWVLSGLLVGAGIYWFMSKPHSHVSKPHIHGSHGYSLPATPPHVGGDLHTYFPHYDSPGQYELGGPDMRFSGQAELQRRLTIT